MDDYILHLRSICMFMLRTQVLSQRSTRKFIEIVKVAQNSFCFMCSTMALPPFGCLSYYDTCMANSALKCRIIILIIARSLCSYNNIVINFGQLYSNSCYTTSNIATLGMCIACEFHQLWVVRPCIYHIFWHLTK